MSDHPRIGVLGAGAVGTLIGGLLAAHGHGVLLVGRPSQVETIKREGLTIEGLLELRARPDATTEIAALSSADLVLVTVKSQDTAGAIATAAPFLQPNATVVSLQNGVRNLDVIAEKVGAGRSIGGVVLLGATYLTDGVVRFDMGGKIVVGTVIPNGAERAREVARILNGTVPTTLTDAIRDALWAKLIINLDLPVFALTGLSYPDGLRDDDIRQVVVAAMREGLREVEAAGFRVDSTEVGASLRRKLALLESAEVELQQAVQGARPFLPSALQSVMRGRPTEVDFINGEIVWLAAARGTTALVNERLCELVRQQTGSRGFLTPDELASVVSG